jgi:GNAT superfamily N-acetyltransferase
MFNLYSMLAGEMPALIAVQASSLCWEDSQMQGVFSRIASGRPTQEDCDIAVSYAVVVDDDGMSVIGWASIGSWEYKGEKRREMQAYVRDDHRRQGIGFSLVAAAAHGMPRSTLPVAVFSEECMRIAQRLGWAVERFICCDDGWVRVAAAEGRSSGGGSDEG